MPRRSVATCRARARSATAEATRRRASSSPRTSFGSVNPAIRGGRNCGTSNALRSQRLRLSSAPIAGSATSIRTIDRHSDCYRNGMAEEERFVYVLRSGNASSRFYVGVTSDVPTRLAAHNAARCPHTARHRPWRLHVVIEFPDEQRAIRFERYLKSGSGRAFARRHFEP